MLSGDDVNAMYQVAAVGMPIDLTGLPLTPENIEFFQKVQAECEAAPKDAMAMIPNEWVDNRFDKLIATSDAAHGGPKIDGTASANGTPIIFG
jgi:hypothetical protein